MEKMFVYPETVAHAIEAESMNRIEPFQSKARAVSSQSNLYRAVLEQCSESSAVATRTAALKGIHEAKAWNRARGTDR